MVLKCWDWCVCPSVHFKLGRFLRKPEILLLLWRHTCCYAKTVTFCNISVISEDIYWKLGVCVHCQKSDPYCQGRQFKMLFLFQNYTPFSSLDFLSSIKHLTAEPWQPSLDTSIRWVLLFLSRFVKEIH